MSMPEPLGQVDAADYPMRPPAAPPSRWEQTARRLAASGLAARWRTRATLKRADAVLRAAVEGEAVDGRDRHLVAAVRAARDTLGLQPRRLQVAAALAASEGCIVEVPTGAGKTLALALAAASLAAQGVPVQVLTANDYLAERDCRAMGALCARLGLSAAAVTVSTPPALRRALHASAVTYCSAREIVFDFMRDRELIGPRPTDLGLQRLGNAVHGLALRGLRMALVDEADAILLDEATTPFVLATQARGRRSEDLDFALGLIRRLRPGVHWRRVDGRAEFTPDGLAFALRAVPTSGDWRQALHAQETLGLALAAEHDLRRDRDYIVEPDGVRIVDPLSGRCADGRRWSAGLHEAVERKEGLASSGGSSDRAAITYQDFFQRYLRFGGMSATVVEARGELASVYGVSTLSFTPFEPSTRTEAAVRSWPSSRERTAELVRTADAAARAGRATLVATASVQASEALAAAMAEAGLQAAVLNARTHAQEAELVRTAGAAGAVTIATALAGRGTDIPTAPEVDAGGGLLVVIAFLPSSRRTERQLAGRTGRAGRPGEVLRHFALDDEVAVLHLPAWARLALPGRLRLTLMRLAQRGAERRLETMRRRLPAQQHAVEKSLTFASNSRLNIGTNQPIMS